ncbi:C25 family cysteine peptidase, partial [Salinivirga cyanobacteriivorans]
MLRTSLLLRSILILVFSVIGLGQLNAQNLEILSENGNTQNEFTLTNSSEKTIELNFQLNSYWMSEVQTPNGAENIIKAMGSSRILEAGAPDLPKFSTTMIIPDLANMDVKIVDSKYIEIENVDVAPSKGNLLRNQDPDKVPFKYGDVYTKDEFFPHNIATLQKPFIARDFRGEALWLYPVQYNPVQKTLRIYTSIELEVFSTDGEAQNAFYRKQANSKISREFHEIYKRQFINYEAAKYDPVTEEGNMLVICYDDWTAEMQPFVDWKKTIGRPTEMVTVTEAGGTAAAIATYVEDYYNTNGLAYLLLVGDAAQVPTNSGAGLGGDSDNAYAYLAGDDHYLEFFVGRFSAESAADVTTQVERILTYEDGNTLSAGWLNRTMGITSQEGTGDDDEYDYEHYLNLALDLTGFTYVESLELFDGDQGGNDEPGNPTPTMVANELNSGVGIINYTGHGSSTTWVSSGFSNSDVNNLTNDNMLPFIWSVACVNGAFDGEETCFAESWMRATNGEAPSGAIGIFASTINQSWAPPMAGQDEMVDILVESYADNIKRTYGGLSVNGCHLMNDEYEDFAMTDTWTIFGDPSLLVRTDDPAEMSVSYNAALLIGQESFTVNCDAEDALVSLTVDGEILGTATVTGGVATVNFPSPTTPGTMTVAVTGFNKKTHIGTVDISPADEPYVVLNSHTIDDAAGNGNGEAEYGESILLDIVLENVAEAGSGYDAANVEAVLSTEDSYVTVTENTETFGTIAAGNTVSASGAYAITFADNIPDQHAAAFTLTVTGDDAKYTWESTFTIVVNAPALTVGVLNIDDTGSGNGDNIIDPGETANLVLTINNDGAADIDNVNSAFTINSGSEYLTFTDNTAAVGAIAAGANTTATYEVTADAATPLGTPVDLTNNVTGGASDQYTASADKQVIIGFVPEYCESGATNSSDTDLTNFEFGDLANNTDGDCGQYDDFTEDPELIHEFMIGATYDVSITLGTCGGTYTKGAAVFVDWNYDGDFDDEGETAFEVAAQDNDWTATGTITIPADAPAGQKFLRVIVQETSGDISPCGTFSWGGTEDYKIILVAPNPPVADFEATPTETTAGMNVAFTDLTTNAPTSWDWTITPGTAGTDFEFV